MHSPRYLEKCELDSLIQLLRRRGFQVVGPQPRDSAIVYDSLDSMDQLPKGMRESQQPGQYRLEQSDSSQYFEFNLGPHSWKQFLFPPKQHLLTSKNSSDGWEFERPTADAPKFALLGVRACELAAIKIQDRVFLEGPHVDPVYQERRSSAIIIAVNCTVAAATCFCTSMGTGPECEAGYDLLLNELPEGFVASAGNQRGEELLGQLTSEPASESQIELASQLSQRAAKQITKRLETESLREDLLANLEHEHWDDVAERCLSCTNCTMVCPTCFCSTVDEVSSLSGDQIERHRHWDSCFNLDFSYTAGGVVRDDRRSRFRQWLTHKLATWHDQFDSSGCVGCGRCITWCPVGIDLTSEIAAFRESPQFKSAQPAADLPIVQNERSDR